MLLSELVDLAMSTINQHGDLPVTILRLAGLKSEEIPVSGLILMNDNEGRPLNVLIEDGDLREVNPKVNLD